MNRRSIEAGKAVIVIDVLDKATSSFNKLTARLTNSAKAFNEIGRQSAGAGLLTGLASRSVVKNFTDFEDKILNLSAKLGYFGIITRKQDQELKSLTKTIIDLGRVTSYTSAEVADAAISLAQAGFSVTEIKSSLQSVLDLARGTNYALGESADLMANMIRTFNMFEPGDSAEVLAKNMNTINHVASMMVKATRLGTIEIEDLRQSMKYAGGTAKQLGANLPVVLGLLVQMSESGLKASLAGTSMNVAFLNLIKNLERLQETLPNFKLYADAAGNVDFSRTFASLMQVTSAMNKIDKTKLFQDVFNIRAARMVASVEEMERVQYFIKEIALAGEEARLSAAKMESGLGGAIRRLTSGLEALNIAMGYTFKDGATAMANFATVGVAHLEKLTAKYKLLVGALVFSPVIFATVAAGAFAMSMVLARLRNVVSGLVMAFKGLKSVGGMMANSAMSAASGVGGLITRPGMRAAAMAAQAKKVAKLQARIDAATLKANARKTPAGQQAALAKIQASKTMQALRAQQAKLAALQKGSISGKVNAAGQFIRNKTIDIKNVKAEKKFYKDRIATYEAYAKNARRKAQYHQTLAHNATKQGNPLLAQAETAKATKASRTAQSAKNIAQLSKNMLSKSSYMKTLFSGAKMGNLFVTLGKGISTIGSLAKSFSLLTFRLTRFVFSWNFVGLALNALLLFGDKIPFIRKAFDDLGKGIGAAFGEIAKIATYAAPALDLFSLAFKAFVSGDTAIGVQALSGALNGIAGIVGNQLSAAWSMFQAKIAETWLTIKQIGVAIGTVISSLIQGIVTIGGAALKPILDSINGTMQGNGGSFTNILATIVTSLDGFITEFNLAVLNLMEWGASFNNYLGDLTKKTLRATGSTGAAVAAFLPSGDESSMKDLQNRKKELEKARDARKDEITRIFNQMGSEIQKANERAAQKSNEKSFNIQGQMASLFDELQRNLDVNNYMRQLENERLTQLQGRPQTDFNAQERLAPALEQFVAKLKFVTGSISSVMGNRILKETPEQIQKETNEILKEINRNIVTQGGM